MRLILNVIIRTGVALAISRRHCADPCSRPLVANLLQFPVRTLPGCRPRPLLFGVSASRQAPAGVWSGPVFLLSGGIASSLERFSLHGALRCALLPGNGFLLSGGVASGLEHFSLHGSLRCALLPGKAFQATGSFRVFRWYCVRRKSSSAIAASCPLSLRCPGRGGVSWK